MWKKFIMVILLLNCIFVASGCGPKITKEQAVKIVRIDVESDGMGKIKIISVKHTFGKYAVKWKRNSNCDGGTEYINDNSGKMEHGVRYIC